MTSIAADAELALRISEAWEAGRAAWPGVALAGERFEAHVRARLPEPREGEALARLHIADLFLACACLHAMPGAIEAFEQSFLVHVESFVRRIDASATFADEIRQHLRVKLFVAVPDRSPRIGDYAGSGPLLGWLRVAATRTALNLRRGAGETRQHALDEAVIANAAEDDFELEVIKERYRAEFQAAVCSAFAQLPQDLRVVMRLHVSAGLSTAKIAPMFQVNQSTVVRWLALARTTVRERTRERLRERLDLSPPEFESLVALLLSRIDITLGSSIVGA